jgi:hypothetical protein
VDQAKDAEPPVVVVKAKDAEPPVALKKARDAEPTIVEKAKHAEDWAETVIEDRDDGDERKKAKDAVPPIDAKATDWQYEQGGLAPMGGG